jgi:hypothetical protein
MNLRRPSLLTLHDPEPEPEGFNYDKSFLVAKDQEVLTKFLEGEQREGGE